MIIIIIMLIPTQAVAKAAAKAAAQGGKDANSDRRPLKVKSHVNGTPLYMEIPYEGESPKQGNPLSRESRPRAIQSSLASR